MKRKARVMKRCGTCGRLRKYLLVVLEEITYTRNYQTKELRTLTPGTTVCHSEHRSIMFSGSSAEQRLTSSYDGKVVRFIREGDRTQVLAGAPNDN